MKRESEILREFRQHLKGSNDTDLDRIMSAFVQLMIGNGYECVVFGYDKKLNYSARACAMSSERIARQMAKTLLAIYRHEGIEPADFLQVVVEFMQEEGSC